jgi:hypothetical protein
MCLGCDTVYDNGGHEHDGSSAKHWITPTSDARSRQMCTLLHKAMGYLSIAIGILSWECLDNSALSICQDNLLNTMTQVSYEGIIPAGLERNALPLLPLLNGIIDNCTVKFPRCAHHAVSLFSIVLARRPSTSLSILDPIELVKAMNGYLRALAPRVSNADCKVEETFGSTELLNALPILFFIGDWKESSVLLSVNHMPECLGSLAINILHSASCDTHVDCPLDYTRFPELLSARVFVDILFGVNGRKILYSTPQTFLAVALMEVLCRWSSHCQVAVSQAVIPCSGGEDCTVKASVAEYMSRWEAMVERTPEVAFILPVLVDFATSGRPRQHPAGLLRGPMLHASCRCAYPVCTYRGDSFSACSGGCRGLARYCCKVCKRLL